LVLAKPKFGAKLILFFLSYIKFLKLIFGDLKYNSFINKLKNSKPKHNFFIKKQKPTHRLRPCAKENLNNTKINFTK
jgi:hypothetical protein